MSEDKDVERDSYGDNVNKCCWIFNSSYNRFIALFYILSYGFLVSIGYDVPASLETEIEGTFNIQPYQFEYLYSIYSSPNIILCFFGGLLIDRFLGIKLATLLMASVSLFGQIIVTVGAFVEIYWVMLLGRLVYGFGAESLGVTELYYAMIWFRGKELNFVCGLIGALNRLGTSFDFLIAYPLYKYASNHLPKGTQLGVSFSIGIPAFLLVICSSLLLARLSKQNGKITTKGERDKDQEENTINFREILKFSIKFWLAVTIQFSFIAAVYVFVSCSQELLMDKYNYNVEDANQIGSLFNIIGALSAPIPGIIMDKIGRELFFTIGGMLLGVISQILLAFTDWNPVVSIFMFAVSFSTLSSCTAPLTSYVVEPYQLGTGFGVMMSLVNLALTVSTLLAGYLLGNFGYSAACMLYLSYLLLGLFCSIVLYILDKKDNGILNLPASLKSLRLQK